MRYLILTLLWLFCVLSSFSQVNLNQGLIAFYPFTGGSITDATGNGINGTANNLTLTTDRNGVANNAYYFNGTNSYIQLPFSSLYDIPPTGEVSISAWIQPDLGSWPSQAIVVKSPFNSDFYLSNWNYGLYMENNKGMTGYANANFVGGTTTLTPNLCWYHLAFTYSNGTWKLYINGNLEASDNSKTKFILQDGSASSIAIGKKGEAMGDFFMGKIDEVRIYNRALNAQEVITLASDIAAPCTTVLNTPVGGTINTYTEVLSYDRCKNQLTVNDGSTFKVGDTVLLIQMKGAVTDSTNTSSFGNIINYKNAGNYEINYVKSSAGNIITLTNQITRQYDIPAGKVQLVRVPYYQSITVTSPLTCLPWDGGKGGILVLNVQNDITLNANLDVSGKGFNGGKAVNTNQAVLNCQESQFYYSPNGDLADAKGEGISDFPAARSFGRGAPANGGGSGQSHNSGGGGGGNGGAGGKGGYELNACTNGVFDNGGLAGVNLLYNTAANKIFMGGGGGSGHDNNPQGFTADGGNGGGICMVMANTLNGNNFSIVTNGNDGKGCNGLGPIGCHEGMGGGGAGGTVLLSINNYSGTTNIISNGGKGADMAGFPDPSPLNKLGPGGGGAGGVCWASSATLSANLVLSQSGGLNGVNLNYGNDPWGAVPGQAGLSLGNLQIPVDNTLFAPNIDSVKIKDSATGCSSYDFKAIAFPNNSGTTDFEWHFGDLTPVVIGQNVSHTYSNPGKYPIALFVNVSNACPVSAVDTVFIDSLNFDFNYKQDVCNPLSIQFFNVGTSVSNPYWIFGDGNTNAGNLTPTHTYPAFGNYAVRFSIQNGTCTDTITKIIPVNIIKDDIIITPDTTICIGSVKQLRTKPALNFCWTPVTYLDNPNIPNPNTSAPQKITYYYTAEVQGNNLIVNGDFSNGNTGFTSGYSFANPNITEGQYFVGPNAQLWNGGMSACPDHTGGNGNMLLVNGAPTPDIGVWKETITVTPNTNYAFSTWIQALYPPNPAILDFSINGKDIGTPITASLPTCTWTQFYTTWNSGNSTTATISIVNKNTQVQGNDFALDDISFAPVLIKQDSVVINVDSPVVKASNDTTVCIGGLVSLKATGAATYTWSPATGLSGTNIPNPIATITANTQYIVAGTTVNGCTAKDTVQVSTFPKPAITKTNDTLICKGFTVQLFAGGGVTYTWSPAPTLSDPNIANPVATPVANTTYVVHITDANTCSNSDSVKVNVKSPPVFKVSGDQGICNGSSANLVASGGDSYLWSPATALDDPNIANPVASPGITTQYSVFITENVCHYDTTLSVTVSINPSPVVVASKSNDIDCSIPTATLGATGAASYTWSPSAGLDDPNRYNPVADIDSTTTFLVKGTDVNGCYAFDSITVSVTSKGKPVFVVPNAFTPNGDGKNDCFGVKKWGNVTIEEFSIFNRWGERVFTTNDPRGCWDGTFKGQKQDPGGFAYVIKARTFCGEITRTGMVILIR